MSSPSKAFDMSKMAIGGIGQMLDSVEFVKRAWSTLNVPSTLVPTVDVEELDKRIADLKAVEQWLNVNLSMLRGTIQGMEIQRGTLAAVKAFGSTLGNMAMPQAAAPAAAKPAPAAPRPAPEPKAPEPAAAQAARAPAAGTTPGAPADAMAQAALPGINPSAWWNLLQQNFNQVAQAALSGSGLQAATANLARAGAAAAAAGTRPKKAAPPPARRAPAKKKAAASKSRAPRGTA